MSKRTISFACAIIVSLGGCARRNYFAAHPPIARTALNVQSPTAENARSLTMFTGEGQPIVWNDVLDAAAWADVIILGEQHDDAVGHAVQLAVVQDVMARWPRSAVSMEMLERDEQPLVDDYMEGIIDAATLAKLTFSESWAGEDSWNNWYQPMIDAAKDAGGHVVAANAPRRYVRLARTAGYQHLRDLPAQRRSLFDLPKRLSDDGYRQRFFDLMDDADHTTTASAATAPEQSSEPDEAKANRLQSGFRSQLLWDATMGASIAEAKRAGAVKVVHAIGQFHSDFNGGTVQQVRPRLPGVKILVVSMQRDEVNELRDEDRGRADIVIYTGKRPPEPEEQPAPQPAATQPAASQPAETQPHESNESLHESHSSAPGNK